MVVWFSFSPVAGVPPLAGFTADCSFTPCGAAASTFSLNLYARFAGFFDVEGVTPVPFTCDTVAAVRFWCLDTVVHSAACTFCWCWLVEFWGVCFPVVVPLPAGFATWGSSEGIFSAAVAGRKEGFAFGLVLHGSWSYLMVRRGACKSENSALVFGAVVVRSTFCTVL